MWHSAVCVILMRTSPRCGGATITCSTLSASFQYSSLGARATAARHVIGLPAVAAVSARRSGGAFAAARLLGRAAGPAPHVDVESNRSPTVARRAAIAPIIIADAGRLAEPKKSTEPATTYNVYTKDETPASGASS